MGPDGNNKEKTMKLTILKEFFAGFLRTRHIARHFRPADADPHRAHDPHAQGAVHRESRSRSVARHDGPYHGRGHFSADGATGALLQIAGAAAALFRFPAGDSPGIRRTDSSYEERLYATFRMAMTTSPRQYQPDRQYSDHSGDPLSCYLFQRARSLRRFTPVWQQQSPAGEPRPKSVDLGRQGVSLAKHVVRLWLDSWMSTRRSVFCSTFVRQD
jgi:hypothetical protein